MWNKLPNNPHKMSISCHSSTPTGGKVALCIFLSFFAMGLLFLRWRKYDGTAAWWDKYCQIILFLRNATKASLWGISFLVLCYGIALYHSTVPFLPSFMDLDPYFQKQYHHPHFLNKVRKVKQKFPIWLTLSLPEVD